MFPRISGGKIWLPKYRLGRTEFGLIRRIAKLKPGLRLMKLTRRPVSMRNLPLRWFFLRPGHQPAAETRSNKIGVGP